MDNQINILQNLYFNSKIRGETNEYLQGVIDSASCVFGSSLRIYPNEKEVDLLVNYYIIHESRKSAIRNYKRLMECDIGYAVDYVDNYKEE